MAVYSTESRMKEISIRKVMEASETGLVYLLSKSFFIMMVIAGIIAAMSTYYVFDKIVLVNLANRVSIGIVDLGFGFVITFVIGMITIGSQTLKAVKTNPATTLRNE